MATDQFTSVEVCSEFEYPIEYLGPNLIADQINTMATIFGLDPSYALWFAKNLPALPAGAEGWFAFPKVDAVASHFFLSSQK